MDKTPDYSTHLNRTVERNIRTLMNRMRSIFKTAGLSAACYIKNQFTSSERCTPCEIWFLTADECIVVGYGSGNTYRLMTKKTTRIVIARDVKFDEASLWLWNVKNNYVPQFLEYGDQEDRSTGKEDEEEKKEVIDIEDHKTSAGTDIGC